MLLFFSFLSNVKVVINKAKRGRGLGKLLLSMLEDYCIKLGYKTLFLDSSPTDPRLYLQVGYSFTEIRPTVVGPGVRIDTLRGYCTSSLDQFCNCLCIFLKNCNTLVTSKIMFLIGTCNNLRNLH